MKNRITPRSVTYKSCILIILVCVFLSAFWALVPLFGWSYYSPGINNI